MTARLQQPMGQGTALATWQRRARTLSMPHAMIVEGSRGIGKSTVMRWLAAALLCWIPLSCGGPHAKPQNVVVIVMDTARPDFMSVYGYERPTTPFLERFAAAGRRFDRAYSVSSWTLPAHASMLTGVLPAKHGAVWHHQEVSKDTPLLAERLRAAGYQTAGFSTNILVSNRTGFDRG